MSNDLLLIGWPKIHQELFIDNTGKILISQVTLERKHGPKLKDCGAVFTYHRGMARTRVIAGWKSVIQNYFIRLGQENEAEKARLKAEKKSKRGPHD